MATRIEIDELLRRIRGEEPEKSAKVNRAETASPYNEDDEEVPVGVSGIMAATEKLLAVNRGLVPTDERDSQQFKRIYSTDKLMRERVKLDADKVRYNILRRAAKTKNLSGMHAFAFDPYTEGHLVGNPLSSPLEEINPIQLVEQSRRVTLMGPGGLGSANAITEEAQAIHPSQFGFLSTLEGPESEKIGIDSRVAWGVKLGSDGKFYQRFRDSHSGKMKWLSATDLDGHVLKLPD